MDDLRLLLQNKKTRLNLIILSLLILMLPVGIFLAKQSQIFFSNAEVKFIEIAEGKCVSIRKGVKVLTCADVPLKLINPFIQASPTPTATSTPTSSGSSSPSPSGSTSPPSSSAGPPKAVNVKQFQNNIQAALDGLKNTGGAVYLPAGTYTVPEKVRVFSNITLFGDGMGQTIINVDQNSPQTDKNGISNDSTNGKENIVIRDLTIQGPNIKRLGDINCCTGILLRGVKNSYVINVEAINWGLDGMYLGYRGSATEDYNGQKVKVGARNVRISGCKVSGNQRHQIIMSNGTGNVIDGCTIKASNSVGADFSSADIDLEPDPGGDVFTRDNKIIGNTGSGTNGILLLGIGGSSSDATLVTNNAVCNNSVGVSNIPYADGGNNNVWVGNSGGNIDVKSGVSGHATGPESACNIPSSLNTLPTPPSKPSAFKNPTDSLFAKLKNYFFQKVYAQGGSFQLGGLNSYWSMEDSNSLVTDSINQNNLSTDQSVTFGQSGIVNKAIKLNGTSAVICTGQSCQNPKALESNPQTGFSFQAWVNPSSYPSAPQVAPQSIILNNVKGATGYRMSFDNQGKIRAEMGNSDCSNDSAFGYQATTIPLNQWTHLVATVSPGNPGVLKIYKNGQLVFTSPQKAYYCDSGGTFMIGSNSESSSTDFKLNGLIDEVALWSKELSPQEVADLYNGGKGKPAISSQNPSSPPGSSSSPLPSGSNPPTASVSPPPTGSYAYRLAETEAGLPSSNWKPFSATNSAQFAIDTLTVSDETPGPKQIWVEFLDPNGKSVKDHITFNLVDKDPEVTGLNCTYDLAKQNIKINVSGQRFGQKQGNLAVGYNLAESDLKAGNNANLDILDWSPENITILFKKGTLTSQTDQSLKMAVIRDDDAISKLEACRVDQSLISLGARVFCREEGKFDVDNVKVSIYYNPDDSSSNKKLSKVDETVTISKDGFIQGLKTKLQSGKNYAISIKAPDSLRRNAAFKALDGTTIVSAEDGGPFILPIGDIAPATNVDGQINSLDRAEILRQWRILGDNSKKLSGDFNRDGRVNSIDWACMRYDFDGEDDPLPVSVPVSQPSQNSSDTRVTPIQVTH